MTKTMTETIVGAAILIVAAFFAFFAYGNSNLKSIDGYELSARFSSVDGISSGSEVRIGGIKVGQVVELDLDSKSYEAILTFQLRDDIELPEDSSAAIVSSSLLGGKYISIEPGGMEEMLEEGDEIAFTQSAVNLESLIGKMVHSGGGVGSDSAESDSDEALDTPDLD